jgi:hypothetical protein
MALLAALRGEPDPPEHLPTSKKAANLHGYGFKASAASAGASSSSSSAAAAAAAHDDGTRGRFAPKPRHAKEAALSRSADWLEGADGGQLAARYGAPPFSVLDARKGYWKKRRRFWEKTYQINSERGRGENLIGYKGVGGDGARGTSVFCPVLTELMYRWFCPAGGCVLDPFAGGSVRGCVAARTGLAYVGIDLSQQQVGENRAQAASISQIAAGASAKWVPPRWVCADSRELPSLEGIKSSFDFVFSCPPYFDLERYSDDPLDLSEAQTYAAFLESYRQIIGSALERLLPDRFCCFVVGEIRDPETGLCRNFVGDTIAAFQEHGATLYNSAVMMLPLHSLPMRAASSFNATAKLGMCHQHVLVFFNGRNPNKAVRGIGLHNAQRRLEWF